MTTQTLQSVLEKLASERWMKLRHHHNKLFLAFGPGDGWERFKTQNAAEFEEIHLLREFLGLPNEQSPIARREQCR